MDHKKKFFFLKGLNLMGKFYIYYNNINIPNINILRLLYSSVFNIY